MKKSEIYEKIKKESKKFIIAGTIILVIIIAVFAFIFKGNGEITINVETSLKEVLETAEVSTVEYTYNSIAEKKEEDNIRYYVKYKGTVKAGFDFERLDVSKDEQDENKLIVTIPEVKINSVNVDENLKYIFAKEKYNTEMIYPEAYKLCCEDLTSKAQSNETLKSMAKESAGELVKALTAPFEKEGYIIDINYETDNKEVQ